MWGHIEKEEDIDAKDFAAKTGMAVNSVSSMIRHAKLNKKLYAEMVALGYSDATFPAWWYSPGREGTEGTIGQEGEQIEERGSEGRKGKDFAPTHPDTPLPSEAGLGRPPLPLPAPSSQVVPSAFSARAQKI